MVSPGNDNPITAIAIVTDKSKCPPDFKPIDKAHDEPNTEADIWKDGFFAFTRIYRYLAVCRQPMRGAAVVNVVADLAINNHGDVVPPGFVPIHHTDDTTVVNVVADLAINNHGDVVPPGFVPIHHTDDTKEKALRKKQLAVRMVPRASAVDAVSDIIILARLKKPPQGYTLAGEIDGLLVCFKYSVIPHDFPSSSQTAEGMYPGLGLPYPIHPNEPQHPNGTNPFAPIQPPEAGVAQMNLLQRQDTTVSGGSGIDGVPFKLHHSLARTDSASQDGLPPLPSQDWRARMEAEFAYPFVMEQQVLTSQLST